MHPPPPPLRSEHLNQPEKVASRDCQAAADLYNKEESSESSLQTDSFEAELNELQSKIKIMYGKKFIKVIRENGVFAFVCKDDVSGPFGSFKKGDVLMPASFNRPALNKARGNVLTGNYPIQWTGPLYLK